MKLAYLTTFDAENVRSWSGTPYYMSKSFSECNTDVAYIGKLTKKTAPLFKLIQAWKKFSAGQRESPRFNIHAAKEFSKQAELQLAKLAVDAIIAPQINPIAYLNCKQPLVLWTDALYASLIGFYPGFSMHSANTIEQGNRITEECLARVDLAIFSSHWAANTAIEIYGAPKDKVKVVPFGANIESAPSFTSIQQSIASRKASPIKFLFLGKDWVRKGGQVVFDVARKLHESGHAVQVDFVGCLPPKNVAIPPYINVHGFISKRCQEGRQKIQDLLHQAHFLFVPSRAEAYGIVFCEANAFALPCLTTHVGGISTIVKDNVNGMTFALNATVDQYCDYIVAAMKNYEEFALRSFHEYQTRLNWQVATKEVLNLIHHHCHPAA